MPASVRLAAIDIGSNGIRLLVAQASGPGDCTVLHRERADVRLGHHTFTKGKLDKATAKRAIDVLREFRKTSEKMGVQRIRAVATSAVRDAEDGEAFARKVRKKAGVKIEVIDGAEEARLIHRAVRDELGIGEEPWIIMDLGGGSLELFLADRDHIRWCESRPLGTVRLLETYDTADHVGFIDRLHERVAAFRVLKAHEVMAGRGLAATGGNIEALADMAHSVRPDTDVQEKSELTLDELRHQILELEAYSPSERIKKWGFRPDRADVILPAALVYERVASLAGADIIHVPDVGVKEGVALDLMDDHFEQGRRTKALGVNVEDAALELGRAFGFEEDHARHVTRSALRLFDDLESMHGLGPKSRRILLAASMLHDVGRAIVDRRHHKHSRYLIENALIPGLTHKQVGMAAAVARYHRKASPKPTHRIYRDLAAKDQARVAKLAALLRLADGLDEGHTQVVTDVRAAVEGDAMVVEVTSASQVALEQWSLEKRGRLFKEVFGRPVAMRLCLPREEP